MVTYQSVKREKAERPIYKEELEREDFEWTLKSE